jgi:hypothetical protein
LNYGLVAAKHVAAGELGTTHQPWVWICDK